MGKTEVIQKADLPAHIIRQARAGQAMNPDAAGSVPTLLEAEQELLVKALAAADGNKTIAAKLLGVSRPRLYKMMERHGVE